MSRSSRPRWVSAVQYVIAFAGVAALSAYVVVHRDQITPVLELQPVYLGGVFLLLFLANLSRAKLFQRLFLSLDPRVGLWEMFILHQAGILLNLLPGKPGTLLRADYMKQRHGLAWSRFGALYLIWNLLMVAVASALALVALAAGGAAGTSQGAGLALAFALALVTALALLVLPIPSPTREGRLMHVARSILAGRRALVSDVRGMAVAVSLLVVGFIMEALRLGLVYDAIGYSVPVYVFLILGCAGVVGSFVSITPGGLGVREALLAGTASLLTVEPEVAVVAAMMDRAAALVWLLVIGTPSAMHLSRYRRRSAAQAEEPGEGEGATDGGSRRGRG